MDCIDVFNGDADGICALHQLRLQQPQPEARLITGVKRDIKLLTRLEGIDNSRITVLDISLDRNRTALELLLADNNSVLYIDHHFSGAIPVASKLDAHIDPAPQTCTSLIVDEMLGSPFPQWAIVGAFGDNLNEVALAKAGEKGIGDQIVERLKEIGVLLNYNGYGSTLADLFVPPADLYREVGKYSDPCEFYDQSELLTVLRQGYAQDMAMASGLEPIETGDGVRVFQLPGEPWARRVVGVFSNQLAREMPEMAHAILIANEDQSFRVSVRAPLKNRTGAETICRQFPTGGGRAAAAGINSLPENQVEQFIIALRDFYSS